VGAGNRRPGWPCLASPHTKSHRCSTLSETERAVELVAETDRETLTEASGGITVESVPDYAATGVDVISMGSLTNSAPTLDLSFRTG